MKKNINDDLSGGDYSMDNAADARNKKNIQWCNFINNLMLLIQNPTSQPRCFNHYHHYYLTATVAHYHHHNHELFTGIFIIIINNIVSAVNITFMANTITNICELCIKI